MGISFLDGSISANGAGGNVSAPVYPHPVPRADMTFV